MKKKLTSLLIILVVAALILSSCGSATTTNTDTNSNTSTQPTQAIVKLSATGTLASGALIGGIDITMHLPEGVTIKSITNPPETDNGMVTASGLAVSNSNVVATYTASSNTVHILLANTYGFSTGEFATVICDVAAGSKPTQVDFIAPNMIAKDLNGSTVSGVTAGFFVDMH